MMKLIKWRFGEVNFLDSVRSLLGPIIRVNDTPSVSFFNLFGCHMCDRFHEIGGLSDRRTNIDLKRNPFEEGDQSKSKTTINVETSFSDLLFKLQLEFFRKILSLFS